jgi:hypothetical protein
VRQHRQAAVALFEGCQPRRHPIERGRPGDGLKSTRPPDAGAQQRGPDPVGGIGGVVQAIAPEAPAEVPVTAGSVSNFEHLAVAHVRGQGAAAAAVAVA